VVLCRGGERRTPYRKSCLIVEREYEILEPPEPHVKGCYWGEEDYGVPWELGRAHSVWKKVKKVW